MAPVASKSLVRVAPRPARPSCPWHTGQGAGRDTQGGHDWHGPQTGEATFPPVNRCWSHRNLTTTHISRQARFSICTFTKNMV
jgi:hypothetical protein